MLKTLLSLFLQNWPILVLVIISIGTVRNYFNRGLYKYPGPLLASLTDWWRFFSVLRRRPDITHLRLHEQHGDIVRLGPNTLSFSNPQALKAIYGLNKGFTKARLCISWPTKLLNENSRDFILFSKPYQRESVYPHCSLPLTSGTTQIYGNASATPFP